MRVALISDVHGNAVALRAVLADVRASRVDRVICLGDVATLGPSPNEVLDLLGELGCPCIRGNHDDFLLDETLIQGYSDAREVVEAVEACRAALGRSELDFVRTFVTTLDLDLDGASLGLFHGSPRSNTEDLLATTRSEVLDEALGPRRPEVMAGGHTHIQMLRQHHGTLLVNPGSVGLAFEAYVHGGPPRVLPHAEYAIVDARRGTLSVELRRVALEPSALIAALASWDCSMRSYLERQYGR